MAVFADSNISFTTSGGTLTGDSNGMAFSGDQLVSVTGLGGPFSGSNLGTLTFSTPKMRAPGNVIDGATFFSGGSVAITGNGSNGIPIGSLFAGVFTSNPSWVHNPNLSNGDGQYTFTGQATGTLADGSLGVVLIQILVDSPTIREMVRAIYLPITVRLLQRLCKSSTFPNLVPWLSWQWV